KGKTRNKPYWPYIFRGYLPFKGEENYRWMSDMTGIDFLKHPDLVLDPRASRMILIEFSKVRMPDYFTHTETRWFKMIQDFGRPNKSLSLIQDIYHDLR